MSNYDNDETKKDQTWTKFKPAQKVKEEAGGMGFCSSFSENSNRTYSYEN